MRRLLYQTSFLSIPLLLVAALVAMRVSNALLLKVPYEVTELQLVLFPLIGLCVSFLIATSSKLGGAACILLTALGSLLASNAHFHFLRPHGTVFFARLQGDTEDAVTREFLKRVASSAEEAKTTVFLQQHFAGIANQQEGFKALEKFAKANALVFGSKRWLQVIVNASHSEPPFEVEALRPGHPAKVITYVPSFGMSADPLPDTARFLGLFFGAIESRPVEEKLRLLDQASGLKAGWTLYGHTAYARWLEGTIILMQALRAEVTEVSELACAREKFLDARRFLRNKDNPALLAAIVNNKAIANHELYIRGIHSDFVPSRIGPELTQVLRLRKKTQLSEEQKRIFGMLEQTRNAYRSLQPKRHTKKKRLHL